MRINPLTVCIAALLANVAVASPPSDKLSSNQRLIEASFELDVDEVEGLLGSGADPNATFGIYIDGMFPDGYGGLSPFRFKTLDCAYCVSMSVNSRKRDPKEV